LVKDEFFICLQIPTVLVFWIGIRITLQLLNVLGINGIRRIEIHTTQPLVPEPSPSGDEITNGRLKSYKSPGIDQIPVQLIQAGDLRSTNFLIIIFGVRKNCQRIRSNLLFCKKDDKSNYSNYGEY
jgi:hypothetical protein